MNNYYKKRDIIELLLGKNRLSLKYILILPLIVYLWYLSDFFNDNIYFIFILSISMLNLYILNYFKMGLIPVFSYFFIVGPGLTEFVIYYITNGNLKVAILAQDYITYDMVREYANASVFGGLSAILGYLLASKKLKLDLATKSIQSYNINKLIYSLCFILFSVTIIYFTYTQGGNIFAYGSYGSALGHKSIKATVGVLNVIFMYFLFASFILIHERNLYLKRINLVFLFFSLALLLFLATRGVRQDPFGVVLVFLLIYSLSNKDKNILKYSILIFFLTWIFTVISGQFRYTTNLEFLFSILSSFFKVAKDGTLFFNLDTASSTVGTFHVAYINVHNLNNMLYGKSYIDWIPRTLPSFLYPNRPQSLAWQMTIDGTQFAMGGVQDIAEQYWNFGRLGVVFISFIIAYGVGILSLTFIQKNPFFIAIPFVWLATLPRWHWYQTFTLYKGFLTILILVFFLHFVYHVVYLNKKIKKVDKC